MGKFIDIMDSLASQEQQEEVLIINNKDKLIELINDVELGEVIEEGSPAGSGFEFFKNKFYILDAQGKFQAIKADTKMTPGGSTAQQIYVALWKQPNFKSVFPEYINAAQEKPLDVQVQGTKVIVQVDGPQKPMAFELKTLGLA